MFKRAGIYLSCFVAQMLIAYSVSGLQRLVDSNYVIDVYETDQPFHYSKFHLSDGLDAAGNAALSPFPLQEACFVIALLCVETVILLVIAAFFYRTGLAAIACLIAGMMFPVLTGFTY